jgi:hypothetical protein
VGAGDDGNGIEPFYFIPLLLLSPPPFFFSFISFIPSFSSSRALIRCVITSSTYLSQVTRPDTTMLAGSGVSATPPLCDSIMFILDARFRALRVTLRVES